MKGSDAAARSKDLDQVAKQLRDGGCPEAEIAQLLGVQDGGAVEFEIWPENADAYRAFLFCGTQWRVVAVPVAAGLGLSTGRLVWLGLDYAAVELAFRVDPPADLKDAWWALRVIEMEAVQLRNQDADQ